MEGERSRVLAGFADLLANEMSHAIPPDSSTCIFDIAIYIVCAGKAVSTGALLAIQAGETVIHLARVLPVAVLRMDLSGQ